MKRLLMIGLILLTCLMVQAGVDNRMDLSGLWRFQLDPMGFGKTAGSELYLKQLTESIHLPGSMDEGGKGIRNVVAHVDRLSRKFEYCGQAWYQRDVEIPETWKGQEILLTLERCHWETAVYVDGKYVATDERLSTPNRFVLTQQMTPGIHTLTLCVDNRLKYPMDQWTHGLTEYTQTNWNGVVGRIELTARPLCHIEKMKVYPDIEGKRVKVCIDLQADNRSVHSTLTLRVNERGGREICRKVVPVKGNRIEQEMLLGKEMKLWDEFSPSLYEINALLETKTGQDNRSVMFGMRRVEQGQHHVRLNNRDIHLRGVLDCCVFPLTGYPATDTKEWKRIFTTVRDYGMNHVRFHSWCPPEAAFDAADELGLYLQIELPMWIKDVGKYPARRDFFDKELYAILDEYGNHPSFLLFCNGNENEGNFAVLEDLIKKGQAYDDRHLYSASTARTHVKADQFFTSHVASKGAGQKAEWITVYEGKPSTDWDRAEASAIDVPVIAHETGQRCMYPNFEEMKKYTGILEPRNFKIFRERLTEHGMSQQADEFFRATGAHTVLQYKEVNEALLRTATSGGFQLLGLSDFPGQGSAFVGILDAFWESKGLVTPEKYRESCAPVVLLARFPKRVYTNEETFSAKIGIYQYGPTDLPKGQLNWQLESEKGAVVAKGKFSHGILPLSRVDSLGVVRIPLQQIATAGRYILKTHIAGGIRNEWNIWVYPTQQKTATDGYVCVRQWDRAKQLLAEGSRVLFIPDSCIGRKTQFTGHFWNPIMFKWDPMIVGTCIDEHHPALQDFPTSYYADWQWWDILNHATAVDLTDLRALTPVIQSVDSYEYNRKLGTAFEAKVRKGKLFVLCVDPEKEISGRPATQQLLLSIKNYISSDRFDPETEVPSYALDPLFDISEAAK